MKVIRELFTLFVEILSLKSFQKEKLRKKKVMAFFLPTNKVSKNNPILF